MRIRTIKSANSMRLWSKAILLVTFLLLGVVLAGSPASENPEVLLIGIGDSLTHGTMDATNNITNTANGYLQHVAESLNQVLGVHLSQPFLSFAEEQIQPFLTPTNLAVDGADVFSIEGIEYFKRVGVDSSFLSRDLISENLFPALLSDKYDKVMYPINLWAGHPVSQIGAANWLILEGAPLTDANRAFIFFWVGNGDSSLAALGVGGSNPQFQPLPFEQISGEIKPLLRLLLGLGEAIGEVSFEPFTQQAIDRNLTEIDDFILQLIRVLVRMKIETAGASVERDWFLLTLPYYGSVGFLFDSEDLEFYLQKVNPAYSVPSTFARVAEPGQPITDPQKGDRVAFFTFGMMHALLTTGHTVEFVNQALEVDGQQRDGLVMSELEQQMIVSRIDQFNAAIKEVAAGLGPRFHVVDVGQFLNDVLTGQRQIEVDDHVFGRKWVRGGAFSFDGVHPSYTGQVFIANFVLEAINEIMGIDAPLLDLSPVFQTDPYIDQDLDGRAPGRDCPASGGTEILFLFKDPDDTNPNIQTTLPPDVWDRISDVFLEELLGNSAIRAEAKRRGIALPH